MSAVVITLDSRSEWRAHALSCLAALHEVDVGPVTVDGKAPVVVVSETGPDGERLLDALGEIPGVLCVDLVSVDFSDLAGDLS